MELKFDKIGNVLKITVSGRLVAACSEEFKDTVSGWLNENKFLLFDLSAMSHIDSSGLGVLVYLLQKVNAQEGALKLACLQPRPRIVFDITKVYRIFEIFDSVDAALASFEADCKK
ncbi:MAG: STAS domain-containing protein [Victivallales bacterium]|jgi:anti-sigma B factor antagonist|nr:STAS domain-containing protein [Victivallales bacterium]